MLSARVTAENSLVKEAEALLSSVDLSMANTEELKKMHHEQRLVEQEQREAAKAVLAFSKLSSEAFQSKTMAAEKAFDYSKELISTLMSQMKVCGSKVSTEVKELSAQV